MKIINVYEQVINYAGLKIDNNKVYIGDASNKDPFLINGKQLIIPTHDMLRSIDGNTMTIMHPLSEDIIKGESAVINKLRCAINSRINIAIYVLMQSLINLAASPEHHKKLSPEQSELLYNIKDVDDKTSKNFVNYMLREVKDKGDRLFSYIYLKRGGTIGDTKYPRVGIVSFPFYQTLLEGEKYKFRVKDISVYKSVFEYMFNEVSDNEAYNYGSNSNVAPFFDALMFTSYRITERLNELTELYREYIDEPDEIMFNHDWYDLIRDPEPLKLEIRAIPSNIVEPVTQPEMLTPNPAPVYNRQQIQYPNIVPHPMMNNQMVETPPKIVETSRGIDFNSLRAVAGIARHNYVMPTNNQPRPYAGDALNPPIYNNQLMSNQYQQNSNQFQQNNMNIPFNPAPFNPRYR